MFHPDSSFYMLMIYKKGKEEDLTRVQLKALYQIDRKMAQMKGIRQKPEAVRAALGA